MKIEIPQLSLVVLMGASGAGKSSFARRFFLPSEIVSSDFCRGLVCDDETSLEATQDAFELVHFIAAKRLQLGKLTVIDATNVQKEARIPLLMLARKHYVQCVALVIDTPEAVCQERNALRPDRQFGPHVVRNHARQLRGSIRHLEKEGFRFVHVLRGESLENVEIVRTRLWNDKRDETGPFDIIGDVHGCADELQELLETLGYARDESGVFAHEAGRKAVFVGDLADRGPRSRDVLELVMRMEKAGRALCVLGNHDEKLKKFLSGQKVKIAHGLQETIDSLGDDEAFKRGLRDWLDARISHYVLDGGRLVVAHAGLKEAMQGRAAGAVRSFCLFGETTGETDEWGLPERIDWARDYRGKAAVVYGHTPVPRAVWLNNTFNLDTGAVFGGALTALRYPEREIVSVAAKQVYAESVRPIFTSEGALSAQQQHDDLLDISDYLGKRLIETRLMNNLTIRAENSAAALEVMSRYAADPKWLVYLPPTMAPVATSKRADFLEYPDQAFDYFRSEGIQTVVCEEKHMGSRAVVAVCRDEAAARQTFGVEGESGIVLTRTGRRFFDDLSLETALVNRLRDAITAANWWEKFESGWFLLDCELMPWSAKAQELIRHQYAPVAAAGISSLGAAKSALEMAQNRGLDVAQLLETTATRAESLGKYAQAFGHYCWDVAGVDDLKLAPFHLLASAKTTHLHQNHVWHMETLAQLASDPIFIATPFQTVDLSDETSVQAATNWWEELTSRGGEGMVVKPLDYIARGEKGLIQPALKVRGREYLRIIYGPEYLAPHHLDRLRVRGLGAKRALALREFSLGVESLERFVTGEPLRRTHECVFGVLALESEPVDPRL
ncbi:MAG TPA: polynucleotide kinase-phosphatase [Abditibacterium sp.]|jgi:protein phosphatase